MNLIGMGMIKFAKHRKFKHIVRFSGIYIKEKYRGRGLGKIFLERIIKLSFSKPGVKKIKLIVNKTQKSAITLYKSCGFKVVGEMKKEFFVDGKYYNAFLMELVR
jgi:RimJ/RimL family protein N-acetyltransferase